MGVLQVDLTKGPEVVETKPILKPRSLVVLEKTEERCIMNKDVGVEVNPRIKLELAIKLEEECSGL